MGAIVVDNPKGSPSLCRPEETTTVGPCNCPLFDSRWHSHNSSLRQSRRVEFNTEKLELPSISQVQTRGPADIPFYNSHYSQRPLLSSDRLPHLNLPQSYAASSSYVPTPPRSVLPEPHFPGGHYGPTAFSGAQQGIGLKTPSPSPTAQDLTPPHCHGLPDDSPEHINCSSSTANIQPYEPLAERFKDAMNQQQYLESHQSYSSAGQSYAPQPATTGGMPHYPQYQQQPPVLQPGPGTYTPSPTSYSQQYGFSNGVTSPQSAGHPVPSSMGTQMSSAMLPLPGESRP